MADQVHVGWGEISPEDAELAPGVRYTVTWEDCCTHGEFTAALVSINRSEEGQVDSVTFGNGVTCDGVTLSACQAVTPHRTGDATGPPPPKPGTAQDHGPRDRPDFP
jgi:hypothetical protein